MAAPLPAIPPFPRRYHRPKAPATPLPRFPRRRQSNLGVVPQNTPAKTPAASALGGNEPQAGQAVPAASCTARAIAPHIPHSSIAPSPKDRSTSTGGGKIAPLLQPAPPSRSTSPHTLPRIPQYTRQVARPAHLRGIRSSARRSRGSAARRRCSGSRATPGYKPSPHKRMPSASPFGRSVAVRRSRG
jgi:hypothetical protein